MSKKIVIEGGKSLKGEVEISGAKNSALPILTASVLLEKPVVLKNIPKLTDVEVKLGILGSLGAYFKEVSNNSYCISAQELKSTKIPYELAKKIRSSVLFLGALVGRYKEAEVPLPGGDDIGLRPINYHLEGLKKLGAQIDFKHGNIIVRADKLKGSYINFPFPTVTGTENLIMASVLAEGETVIDNAACEPEVVDLANFLNKAGAKINGIGTKRLIIEGVDKLEIDSYEIIPDRIEAGTFAVAGALTSGDIKIKRCNPEHMRAVIDTLRKIGVSIEEKDNELIVNSDGNFNPINIRTDVYPGFPTDLQAQFMTLLCLAKGVSTIEETIFEKRFKHAEELKRLGACIDIKGNIAIIYGPCKFSGAPVEATDIRASAALVLAGLIAEGTTTVHNIYHIDRGYEAIEKKLTKLGAKIYRI